MARRFPLDGLLRARRLSEERAAATLERANHGRRAAEVAVDDARTRLTGLGFASTGHAGATALATPETWQIIAASRAASATTISELTGALHEASTKADLAAQQWGEARMRVSMIEKLGERHAAKVAAEDLAAEQLVLDEAALRRSLDKEDR